MNATIAQAACAPEWSNDMRPGAWYRISGNSPDLGLPQTPIGTRFLCDNNPARDPSLNPALTLKESLRRLAGREWIAPWSGKLGFAAITEAWNSAVYASGFGHSGGIVVFGGGHNNYFGSDVHAFDLSCREWQRLTTGFVTGDAGAYGEGAIYPDSVYPDGSPLPPHTYDYVQYDSVGNNFMLLKGQIELGPNVRAVATPHLFNLDSLEWRHGPRHPTAILNSGGFSTFDDNRRILWGHSGDDGGGNAFIGFCPDGANDDGTWGHWTALQPNKLPGEANHNAMQYDPENDRLVMSLHARDMLAEADPDDTGRPIRPLASQGPKPRIQEYAALEWSATLESLIYYSATDGANVYAIECDQAAHWKMISATGTLDPVADAADATTFPIHRNHTFGRFRVAHFEHFDLAVLVRHVDSPVYAMRLCA